MTTQTFPTRFDLGRAAYWAVKFFQLFLILAVLALGAYAAWCSGWWLIGKVVAVGHWLIEHSRGLRRAFFSVAMMAIFFYFARFVRAGALLLEARARKERL